jgi:hypothetical protein
MEFLKSGRWLTAAFLTLALAPSAVPKPDDEALENQVKAAFLYNFLKFVDWPTAQDSPWVIGVVGSDAFAGILVDTVRGKTVKGYPVTIKRLTNLAGGGGCQIVFVPTPAQAVIAMPPGVLTVGGYPHFVDAGGIVGFYLEEGRVRFEIQAEAAKAAGLRVSAQLLKLSRIR